jgi:tetratricopeptide (TPR) repeat protein
VTDFGLAQVQGDARMTMTGDLVGTLRYMSPEQALAKRVVVDHRTDIYSLGATLYELLTLEPAYRGNDRQELLRQISFEEPKAPRRVNKSIPPELETIVMKAMEKNPTERYATAKDLADDLRHFLDDKPIQARRASVARRALKWARRHRATTVAALVVTTVTLLLSGGTAFWWLEKRRAAELEVELALDEAIRFQDKEDWPNAVSAAQRAKGLMAGGSISQALQERVLERCADVEMAKKLDDIPVRIWASHGDYSSAMVASALAKAFREFGVDLEALEAEEAAKRIAARSIRLQLVIGLDLLNRSDKSELAIDSNKLLAIANAEDPNPDRKRLREALVKNDRAELKQLATSEEIGQLPPTYLYGLAQALRRIGARNEALEFLHRAWQNYPHDFFINETLANISTELKPPRYDEAIRYYSIAVSLHPENANAHINLGMAFAKSKRFDEAIDATRVAIRIAPRHPFGYSNLGAILERKGDLDGAIQAYEQGVLLRPDAVVLRLNYGIALAAKDRPKDAEEQYREAIRLWPDVLESYTFLGELLEKSLHFEEARRTYLRGLEKLSDKDEVNELKSALKKCEDFIESDTKLSKILKGEAEPANNAERFKLARFCLLNRKLYFTAVRFFREAFALEPEASEKLHAPEGRYNAACAAALAGCGQGKDAEQTDDQERARLRKQALDWLRADLSAYRLLLDKQPNKASFAQQRLQEWLEDKDFSGIRGESLANFPEAERQEWQQLWADVDALKQRAAKPPAKGTEPPKAGKEKEGASGTQPELVPPPKAANPVKR